MNPEVFELDLFETPEDKKYLFDMCKKLDWKTHTIKIQGKEFLVPRLIAWYGEVNYKYSGITHYAQPMPGFIEYVKEVLEKLCSEKLNKKVKFNSVLLNYYRNGSDSISFHSDDERELDEDPVIASVSLGATRKFIFKNKENSKLKKEYLLTDGHCLVMHGETQKYWLHGIPKEPEIQEERINLTFRFTHPKAIR
jgi:alkylated DNA repair dioxygenase AlkB